MRANFFKFFKGEKEDLYLNGIYKISFGNEKCYIGSTAATFKNRFATHYNNLNISTHYNSTLLKCFKKYKNKITFEIIEIIENHNLHNILNREQYWIDYYNSYHEGYNEVKFAGHTTGFKMPEEILKKRRKAFLQYDLDGNFIKEWDSLTRIQQELGSFGSKKVLEDSFHSSHGFLWRKKLSDFYPLKIEPYQDKKISYKILMYDIEGNFIKEFNSILEASINKKIPIGNISKALKNNNMAYGFIWKKWEKNYPLKIKKYEKAHPFQKNIKVTNIETNTVEIFKTKRDLCRKLKINRSAMKHALENNNGLMVRKKLKIEEITI